MGRDQGRLRRGGVLVAFVLAACLAAAPAATAGERGSSSELRDYAKRTWKSFEAMTDRRSGLPADILEADGSRSVQTSTTNIGAYMWSAVAARELGIISRRQLVAAARQDAHDARVDGALPGHGPVLQLVRPPHGREAHGLAAAARRHELQADPVVGRQRLARGRTPDRPQQRPEAAPAARARSTTRWTGASTTARSVNRVLFHFRPDDPAASPCCYDTVVSESRIVDYLGIARGQLPQKSYYGRWRTFPDTCDYGFQETRPVGTWRTYFGVDVFEGAYQYAGTRLVPSWGGSMFEALMPALFVPEEQLGAALAGARTTR